MTSSKYSLYTATVSKP